MTEEGRMSVKPRFWVIGLLTVLLLLTGCATLDTGSVGDVPLESSPQANVQSSAGVQAEASETATPYPVSSTDDVLRIGVAEAGSLVAAGEALLVDTRSEQLYWAEHAAGAISLPEFGVADRLGELPTDQTLIFYCT
jgi:hypothetical protein